MKKLLLLILIPIIFTACTQVKIDTPEMTAPEVCQYVTEALPDKYVYENTILRIEYKYQAKTAHYKGLGVWRVQVVRDGEWQRLYKGQWSLFTLQKAPEQRTLYCAFNESTAEIKQVK